MSRIVVCDTGPLLHLDETSAIHLLEPAGQILIPPVVSQELASRMDLPNWVNIEELNRSAQAKVSEWSRHKELDSGEAEAIALAIELGAAALLIDEKKGRNAAKASGIATLGTVTVLELAAENSYLSCRRPLMPCNVHHSA